MDGCAENHSNELSGELIALPTVEAGNFLPFRVS
jgi:hypothetical protein